VSSITEKSTIKLHTIALHSGNAKDSSNDFFVTKCPSIKKLKKCMSEVNLNNKPAVAVIVLIMSYFKEDEEVLLCGFEVSQKHRSVLCNKLMYARSW